MSNEAIDVTESAKRDWKSVESLLAASSLLAWVFTWFFACGYGIGLEDHYIHFVFLERARDPSFLKGDLLADSAPEHLSFFWNLQAPLVGSFGLEKTYFAIHVVSVGLMFAGLAALVRAVAPRAEAPLATGLACALGILRVQTFAFIPAFDTLVLNRTLVLGPELFALALALRGRIVAAFLLVGVIANIHATTAAHTAAIAFFIAGFDKDSRKRLALGCAVLFLAAAPLMIKAVSVAGHSSIAVPYALWREAVERHFPFHHFASWFSMSQWGAFVVPTIAILLVIRREPRKWGAMLAAVTAVCIVNFIATDILHLRVGVALHLYEITRLLTFMGYAAGAVALVYAREEEARRFTTTRALAVAAFVLQLAQADAVSPYSSSPHPTDRTILFVVAVTVGAALFVDRRVYSRTIPPLFGLACALGLAIYQHSTVGAWASIVTSPTDVSRTAPFCAMEYRAFDPDHEINPPRDEMCGMPLMEWARQALPANARVAMPPFFLHTLGDFRYLARRSVFVTFKDGGEATFSDAFAKEWLDRMSLIAGPLPDMKLTLGGFWKNILVMEENYGRNGLSRWRDLRDRYGVTHAICAVGWDCGAPELPILYEDKAFRVIALPPKD